MPRRKMPAYPFVPRSTAGLVPGQFFSFSLSNGLFACGRILALAPAHTGGSRSLFYCGLMDWCGEAHASTDDIAGRILLYHNWMHIVIFSDYRASIEGYRPLSLDAIEFNCSNGASGSAVLKKLAERHFGGRAEPGAAANRVNGPGLPGR